MLTIYAVGLGKNEGISLHVHIPNTFFISFLFLYDAICIGEDDFVELRQASKSGGRVTSSILMALASILSLEDLVAKCNMDISKLQENIKVVEDRMKVMEER